MQKACSFAQIKGPTKALKKALLISCMKQKSMTDFTSEDLTQCMAQLHKQDTCEALYGVPSTKWTIGAIKKVCADKKLKIITRDEFRAWESCLLAHGSTDTAINTKSFTDCQSNPTRQVDCVNSFPNVESTGTDVKWTFEAIKTACSNTQLVVTPVSEQADQLIACMKKVSTTKFEATSLRQCSNKE